MEIREQANFGPNLNGIREQANFGPTLMEFVNKPISDPQGLGLRVSALGFWGLRVSALGFGP